MLRKNVRRIYLGLDPSRLYPEAFHYPIIRICSFAEELLPLYLPQWPLYTDLVVTSQTALQCLNDFLRSRGETFAGKSAIAVGKTTAAVCRKAGLAVAAVACPETAEGMVPFLEGHQGKLFYPHSAKARPLLREYLQQQGVLFDACPLYDTLPNEALPAIDLFDFTEVIFTSPSTVYAFWNRFGQPPEHLKLTSIGPITQKALDSYL